MENRAAIPWFKLALLILIATASGIAFLFFGDDLTLASLARHEARWRAFYAEHRWLTYLLVLVLYTAINGISVPGAGVALTLFFGWFFGFSRAVILVSLGSTAGASVAFLLSRYLLRDLVAERFPMRIKLMQKAFEHDGAWYLLTLRLLPVVPYFLINILMGLTTIRLRTFWWVSQVGMLPATCLYAYTASSVPSLHVLAQRGATGIITPQLLGGLTLLALFPLGARGLLKWRANRKAAGLSRPQ